MAKDDAVYLTDNDFGLRDGGKNPDKQLQNGIWRIKDGKSTMVLDATMLGGIPNGIVLSPDETYLYANAGQRMMRYEVKADGSLGPGSPFTQGPGIGDGMKVDTLGNVYSTSGAGPGIVRITSPTGTLLGYLNLPIVGGEPKRADLRDQRRVRRPRRQEPLRHRVRPRLSHPPQGGGRDAGTEAVADCPRGESRCVGHTVVSPSHSRRSALSANALGAELRAAT